MTFWLTILAAGLSASWFLVHVFIGGPEIADPIREDDTLPPVVRGTLWLCWQLVSVTLITITAFLAGGLFGSVELLFAGTLLAGLFTLTGLFVPPILRESYRLIPQGWMFMPVALFGALALVFAPS